MKGRSSSAETRQKQRLAKLGFRGPQHWNWRGGSGSERNLVKKRDEYVQWRKAVFERDNFTCQACGARGCELHADHIHPWASHIEKRFDLENGRTLCVPCHWKTPSFPKQLIPKEMKNGG
jgi:5-methylcytosine-specific restriction endonuclease McrA